MASGGNARVGPVTGPEGMAGALSGEGWVGYQEKVLPPEGSEALTKALHEMSQPQGCIWTTLSGTRWVGLLRCPGQELD